MKCRKCNVWIPDDADNDCGCIEFLSGLEQFRGDVLTGCDIQRGNKLYRQVEVMIGGMTIHEKEIEDAKKLLRQHLTSDFLKQSTLNDMLRNLLSAYVANKATLDEYIKNACPECLQYGCGGHR